MPRSHRIMASFMLCGAISSWASAPVFIRLLSDAYDPYSQAFVRYFAAAATLACVCLVAFREEYLRLILRPGPILAIGLLNAGQQFTWTLGCYGAPATMAQLITKLNVIFIILFSFFFFREERGVIRSPLFLLGTAMSFIGVAVLLSRGGLPLAGMSKAEIILVTTAISWGLYFVWSKHLVMTRHPVPMFAALSLYTTLGLGILSFAFGEPSHALHVGARTAFITFLSGLFPIAMSHPMFNYAQKHLGSAFCGSCNLLSPFLTFLLALVLLNDTPLSATQWLGALVQVGGIFLVVWAGQRAHKGTPSLAPDSQG